MNTDLLSALAAFAFVTSITPGPNNLMLMTSGANYGFRRTIPHMLGVGIGFTVMVVIVGLGLMQVFDAVPITHTILKYAGMAYLLWLAWKIAHAEMPDTTAPKGKPMTFIQAALFQWVNPKAWQMALTAITLYAPDRSLLSIVLVGVVFGMVNLPSVSTWTVLGQQLRRILSSRRRLIVFNYSMALLLVATLVPVM
ncbi:Threonine/homoserine/homoserine lactone efflux protein [Thalassovita litoralis]|jgi:threonine/homoserine/homoserine lactone efflux protein|uniref:Threonine/homoserine/homoserine lactone efflux protein n=1 Tax=Thalassovita litoralis TaxID=1010611 RepID=A0A521CGI9_9RHOB|nr:LysE family translocator [Thalassovita litoralis]SMO58485.1 Threonine/homoserine/homoserine lactone efflux protein [Thalassovita litoralis]